MGRSSSMSTAAAGASLGLAAGVALGRALQNPAALSAAASRAWGYLPSLPSLSLSSSAPGADPSAKDLPRWDLEQRFGYASVNDPKLDETVAKLVKDAEGFARKYKGKLSTELAAAVADYEALAQEASEVMAYVSLHHATDQLDPELQKRLSSLRQTWSQASGDHLTWFDLQLAALPQAEITAQAKALRGYKSFIDEVRKTRPHQLSEEVERALTVREAYSGSGRVVEFYEKEEAKLEFKFQGKTIGLEEMLAEMHNKKPAHRAAAMACVNDGLKGFVPAATHSLNMVTGSWLIENKERGYKAIRSQRNLSNNIPDEVVDSLLEAVRTTGVAQCKRYYTVKKAILKATTNMKEFTWSDRNAPLDLGAKSEKVPWPEAVEMVEKGFNKFSPKMASLFRTMVDEKRIDVPTAKGKRSGAFCHGTTPRVGPFQLLNYTGEKRDVMTLAHESGHGCHDYLAYEQGFLQYHPPLTLAECASIFGEMVVFRDLLASSADKREQLAMLMSKLDDIVNSVVRQCSFDFFEHKVHEARQKGEVGAEEIQEFWMSAVKEYYGEEGEVFEKYANVENLWTYVGHFHFAPFYVYSYAFADLVVGTLYATYQQQPTGFEPKLLGLLAAGSTKEFTDALAPFGLKPDKPEFWHTALGDGYLGALLKECETLAKELGYA